eukprot:1703644-Karenia_brevis.AAC.1
MIAVFAMILPNVKRVPGRDHDLQNVALSKTVANSSKLQPYPILPRCSKWALFPNFMAPVDRMQRRMLRAVSPLGQKI